MAHRSYAEGLKIATETANKAIAAEASLSTLSPLVSPLPTLQKAFPLYISAAEAYSHLLKSNETTSEDRETIRKRWRLVLERAEKVKKRIEELGGQVGKVEVSDEQEEDAVYRRGRTMNGVNLERWKEPARWEFEGTSFRDEREPEMPNVEADWEEASAADWDVKLPQEEVWTVKQGTGADCSVAAGLGICLEHNRRWGTSLGQASLYPQSQRYPRKSDNGKHVVKLLLNGAWRSIIVDALLPRDKTSLSPLHATSRPLTARTSGSIGPPWVPLVIKGYFKSLGGYTMRGSDPAPDIYAITGWIPERLSLKEGFQREKEWNRIYTAWKKGHVLVTLGTGKVVGAGLVALHAYGVIDVREENGERLLQIVDPGATSQQLHDPPESGIGQLSLHNTDGSITMSWDQVCSDFEALSLNWDPALYPTSATRHWSWQRPSTQEGGASDHVDASPRYRLSASGGEISEIWILLSQHTASKDRPLDDIALHVFEEHQAGSSRRSALHPHRQTRMNPYTNGLHVLVRHTPRTADCTLDIMVSRDRGMFQRDFTLQAFAPQGTTLTLRRITTALPFSHKVDGQLNSRNCGGHPGSPTHGLNPQYRCVLSEPAIRRKDRSGEMRLVLQGEREVAWNVKLLWGSERVHDLTEDAVISDSGPYAFGMAYCDIPTIESGAYTVVVSAFEAGTTGPFSLSIESSLSLKVDAIAAEGAGLYSRTIHGRWDSRSAGGRPSGGAYTSNPKVEVILPKSGMLMTRLYLPHPPSTPLPINLTIFKRGTNNELGEQVATTGPYSDALSGVAIPRTKLESGIYLLVPSGYEKGREGAWVLHVWSDVAVSAELVK